MLTLDLWSEGEKRLLTRWDTQIVRPGVSRTLFLRVSGSKFDAGTDDLKEADAS